MSASPLRSALVAGRRRRASPLIAGGAAARRRSINGAGSTWSQIAVDQWRADVARQGLSVNYQGVGSTPGRQLLLPGPGRLRRLGDPVPTAAYRDATGTVSTNEIALAATARTRTCPIVAGGTSFMYHLDINGQRVTNLRLSPDTIAKIFTGGITNWNDPAIAADNPVAHFPNLPIRPVVRSDGSGTTAQFTAFMASRPPTSGTRSAARRREPATRARRCRCGPTSTQRRSSSPTASPNFVAAPYNNGAITYVEYGYAQAARLPGRRRC